MLLQRDNFVKFKKHIAYYEKHSDLYTPISNSIMEVSRGCLTGMTLEHDFVDWLYSEIASKGWTNNELARRAGVTSSAMSLLLNKKNNPGLETCVGIAEALGYPPEYVLRKAGLIPPLPASPDDERIKEVREIMRNLPEDDQEEIRQYVWFKLQQYTKRSRNGNHDQP